MVWLEQQCDLGPRIPGSTGNTKLREIILETAREQGLQVATDCFKAHLALGDSAVEVCNVIVSAGPAQGPRLWLGAHFDTRPICDRDPSEELQGQPLVGANDGASGVAILLHLMELLGELPPTAGVDLLFFDGEDSGVSGGAETYCVGSQHLATTLGDFSNPLDPKACEGLIVLDMVGERDLYIPMESYSHRNAPEFSRRVFLRAEELNLLAFSATPGPGVFDDHVPFLQQGIPAVDLIDFDYRFWHTTGDVPSACSAGSLAQVGTLVTDLVYRR